ncbi:MAG: hypothetical protein AAGG51_08760 [Cyanobacteria bacterium P01_G01_bin.54]
MTIALTQGVTTLRNWLIAVNHPWRLPLGLWLGSRLLILLAIFIITPLISPELAQGWDTFTANDGQWYLRIATEGYTSDPDGALRSPAFFPLFPGLIGLLSLLQIPPVLGGLLINNLAFFGAVLLLHRWLRQRYTLAIAHWTIAVLCLHPGSLFGTVLYSEGSFIFLSVLLLTRFEAHQLGWMTIAGMLVTALRPPGIAFIPALLLQAWRERRSWLTYGAILLLGGGLAGYGLYCWWQWGDPLTFSQSQAHWGRDVGSIAVWWQALQITLWGQTNHAAGAWVRWDHPLAVLAVTLVSLLVWSQRQRLGPTTPYWTFFLATAAWLVGDYGGVRLVSIFGGLGLLWYCRTQLSGAMILYGYCGLALLIVSGNDISAERLTYGIVSLTIAAGAALDRHPRLGYGLLPLLGIMLLTLAIQCSQGVVWV